MVLFVNGKLHRMLRRAVATVMVAGAATGLLPGQKVTIMLGGQQIGGAQTDDKGAFQTPSTIPSNVKPGRYSIQVLYYPSGGFAGAVSLLVSTFWPQYGDTPGHTHVNTSENVLSTDTVAAMTMKWSVYANAGFLGSSAAVVNRIAYVGATAFDAATGTVIWSHDFGQVISSPAVVNGTVYVGASDGKVYALDAATGAIRWSHPTNTTMVSSPAVANGTVYIGSDDGNLYALSAETGALLWSYHTDSFVESSPAVANGTVYVGSTNGTIYALDATTGALKWSFSMGGTLHYYSASPSVANGTVYVGSENGILFALRATTGALRWSYKTGGPIWDSPAVTNSLVYIGNDSKMYALARDTGLIAWSFAASDGVVGTPGVANDVVYVGTDEGNIYALNGIDGAPLWSYHTPDVSFATSAVVSDGMVYVGGDNGVEYAFGL